MQMIFDLTAKKLISYDSENSSENLRENFVAFIQGLISFPLDVPGTAYHKCLQVIQIWYSNSNDMHFLCVRLRHRDWRPKISLIIFGLAPIAKNLN